MASTAGGKRISQATFDAAVQENIEEFEMTAEEAVEDAIEQFNMQGVDLSNIITKVQTAEEKDSHPVLAPLKVLASAVDADDADELVDPLVKALQELQLACKENPEHKSIAGSNGAMEMLGSLVAGMQDEARVMEHLFRTVRTLTAKHPENRKRIHSNVVEAVNGHLQLAAKADDDLLTATLSCAYGCSYGNETYKVSLFKKGAADAVLSIFESHTEKPAVLKESFSVLRTLVTADDRDTPTSKAFEHARDLHERGAVDRIVAVAKAHPENATVLTDVFATLAAMSVSNAICTDVVEAGGLDLACTAMTANPDNQRLIQAGVTLFKVLAGNDDNKKLMGKPGAAALQVLLQAMQRHCGHPKIQEQSCAALAALTLRSPENAVTVVDKGAHTLLVDAMRKHPTVAGLQGTACLAMRNIVSRTPELRQKFLDAGAEVLLRMVVASHPRAKDKANAALRDLGLEYGAAAAAAAAAAGAGTGAGEGAAAAATTTNAAAGTN